MTDILLIAAMLLLFTGAHVPPPEDAADGILLGFIGGVVFAVIVFTLAGKLG